MRLQVVSTGRLPFSADRPAVDRFEMLVLADHCRLNEERAAILDDARRRGRVTDRLSDFERFCRRALELQ